MIPYNKLKNFNDPIYGFISVPDDFIFDLIEEPYLQRLRRISQMGIADLVFPGAKHTRFHHVLGAMHLMQQAVQVLRSQSIDISKKEEQALYIAILLHDIGHGPFSHAMEHSITYLVSHEEVSLIFMKYFNQKYRGKLDLAIEMFTGKYYRTFFYQLISSQLDMDRLDYLKRDSFYAGVPEGNINSQRLIQMLTVYDNRLMIKSKGVYSVENFLLSRRLMYWQVYYHKTSLVTENLLILLLKRAKELLLSNTTIPQTTRAFDYFLRNKVDADSLTKLEVLDLFSQLDDSDILIALKQWQYHSDRILSEISQRILQRSLLRIKLQKHPFEANEIEAIRKKAQDQMNYYKDEVSYVVFCGEISNQAYNREFQYIEVIYPCGRLTNLINATDQDNLQALALPITKYYLCYPKELDEN